MSFDHQRTASHRRPGYAADQRRRRAFVAAELRRSGEQVERGLWRARCLLCGHVRTLPLSHWWADHIDPVAAGGSERGQLRLSCKACQVRQGSQVGNARNPMAVSRKRPAEEHPGRLE